MIDSLRLDMYGISCWAEPVQSMAIESVIMHSVVFGPTGSMECMSPCIRPKEPLHQSILMPAREGPCKAACPAL